MKFLLWCVENKPNWLTADGTDCIAHIMEEHGGEGVHAQRSYTCTEFFGLLHSCDESPVLLLGEVTPHGVMEYAMGCRNLGLPPLIPLLQCVNRLGFEVCSVNNCQTEQGSLIMVI